MVLIISGLVTVSVERQLPTSRREKWFGVIPRGWMTGCVFGLINAGLAFIYMDFTGWGRIENVDAECEYLGYVSAIASKYVNS